MKALALFLLCCCFWLGSIRICCANHAPVYNAATEQEAVRRAQHIRPPYTFEIFPAPEAPQELVSVRITYLGMEANQ